MILHQWKQLIFMYYDANMSIFIALSNWNVTFNNFDVIKQLTTHRWVRSLICHTLRILASIPSSMYIVTTCFAYISLAKPQVCNSDGPTFNCNSSTSNYDIYCISMQFFALDCEFSLPFCCCLCRLHLWISKLFRELLLTTCTGLIVAGVDWTILMLVAIHTI